jgi:crotonobetainyl-CoA:carnitine CoA-transferase CaiB-like acyl-CoA transferase
MDLGSRYSMYWTSDRRALLVCPIEKHFWERFCDAVGLGPKERATGNWPDGVDFGRGYDDEKAAIAKRIATRPLDAWQAILAEADVPFAPILTWIEAMESGHAAANGVTVELTYGEKPIRAATTPVSVTPVSADTSLEAIAKSHRDKGDDLPPPPRLGEQSLEILEELGVAHLAAEVGAAKP